MSHAFKQKKLTAILLVCFMLLLSACGSSGGSGASSDSSSKPNAAEGTSASGGSSTVRVWIANPTYQVWLEEVIPIFEKENPDIKVDYLTLDWSNYKQKILTAMAGGGAPDLISIFGVDVAPFVSEGVLQPIGDLVDTSIFDENYLASGMYNDTVYAVPMGMNVRPLFYDKALVESMGFKGPPENYAQLLEYAKALTQKDASGNIERVGFWVPMDHPYKTVQTWLEFLLNNGGQLFDENGKAAFNSPEGIESVQLFADILAAGADVPGTIKAENTDWQQGRVAMLVANNVTRNLLDDHPELVDRLGIAVPPYGKKPVVELSGSVLGLTTKSKNQDAAIKLMNFLTTNEDVMISYLKADTTTIPSLKGDKIAQYINDDPFLGQLQELGNKYGVPLPSHPQWPEINDVLKTSLTEAWNGSKSAKAAMDEAADKINSLLGK